MIKNDRVSVSPGFSADIVRMRQNVTELLDVMSEFVLLINKDHQIEFVNKRVSNTWKDIARSKYYRVLMGRDGPCQADCPVQKALNGNSERLFQKQIRDRHVEISVAPFQGYLYRGSPGVAGPA